MKRPRMTTAESQLLEALHLLSKTGVKAIELSAEQLEIYRGYQQKPRFPGGPAARPGEYAGIRLHGPRS